jgi:hypothetical protein
MINEKIEEFIVQKEEEKDPEGTSVSFSQYSTWLNCPHQWKLNYVDKKYQFDQSIHTVFGTAIHNTIQWWLPEHFADPKKAKKWDVDPIFKEYLIEEFKNAEVEDSEGNKFFVCDMDTLQEFYEDGCAILDHVLKYGKDFFPTKDFRLVGCEVKLLIPIKKNIYFKAYLDIVIHDTKLNEYHIIDLKTSTRGWYEFQKKDPKKLHQILLYKKFFAERFNVELDQIHPRFIILKRKITENSEFIIRRLSKFEPSHGKVSMKRMMDSWESFLTECFDENGKYQIDKIKPNSSKQSCKYCPYNDNKDLCSYSYYLKS